MEILVGNFYIAARVHHFKKMVRQYIDRYIGTYFSQRMSTLHHGVILVVLAIALVPVVFCVYALQLGVVFLAHAIVQHFVPSWIVFMIASAALLTIAGYFVIKGVYELFSFIAFTWSFCLPLCSRLTMSIAFIVDFLISDTIIALGAVVTAYAYLLIGLNERLSNFELLTTALVLLFIGVLFQVAFMSAYSRAQNFSQVVSVSKRFLFTYPQEEAQSPRKN